jgi:hypothetical protein
MAKVEEVSKSPKVAGPRKASKRNQELKRCRKALAHAKKRGWMTDALEQHIKAVETGSKTESCDARVARRMESVQVQREREAVKAAKRAQQHQQHQHQVQQQESSNG